MKYKRLEKLFNLKSTDETLKKLTTEKDFGEKLGELQNLLESNDSKRVDEIKTKALEVYKDLIESGFSCDPKHASNFLDVAAKMLEIALNAEKIKIDRKLEMKKLKLAEEKLKLMKRKIEIEEKNSGTYLEADENGIYVERNELLKKLLDK